MLNLLNATDIRSSMFWMLVILGIFLIVEIAVFAILMIYRRHKPIEEKTRQVTGIRLDTDIVKREYKVGEKFDPTGLIVTAHYSDEPLEEKLNDFTIVTPELLNKLESAGKKAEDLLGCRIYAPDLSVSGNLMVTVAFQNQTATYAITVTGTEVEPAAEAPVETVNYTVNVNVIPDEVELSALQVALYNGDDKVAQAANVEDGVATIAAPAGEYIIKVFGLPDDDYVITAELLSAEKLTATITIDYCEDYYDDNEGIADVDLVDYKITVVAPEELDALQVALYNGDERVGQAANVENGVATIAAPAGEYMVKVFGLPDDDYVVTADLLSEDKPDVTVTIDYCEDYYTTDDREDEPETEEAIPVVSEIIGAEPEEELVEYNVIVNAPESLSALQVALYNGDVQVGDAVNVESGAATLTAAEGEYAVRIFGVPEGYTVSEGTVSATRHICTVTVTEPVHEAEEELAVAEEVAPVEEPVVVTVPAEPVVIVEESFEGGILRYDRSFTARLIQSTAEVKDWYTDLKNNLLSYKKVHDRMSWKRESYNYGRLPFARLAYRGDTLCIYLPLDPDSLADSKYKVESVSDSASYVDTPCLYRIKNNKRAKYAKELIAMVAEILGAKQVEREAQDYYVPYEGLVELINKGLIKRNVKSKKEEIFFTTTKSENE